jgi:hypothetical protein
MRDIKAYSRNVRNENRTSISTGSGEPSPNNGNDGDIQINTTSSGLKLYAKYQGQWYSRELKKLLNKPKKISPIGVKINRPVSDLLSDNAVMYFDSTWDGLSEDGLTFENDIVTLAAKLNEIIEKIQ